jgi:hypothetical protein
MVIKGFHERKEMETLMPAHRRDEGANDVDKNEEGILVD